MQKIFTISGSTMLGIAMLIAAFSLLHAQGNRQTLQITNDDVDQMQMAPTFAQRQWRDAETRCRKVKSSKKPATIGRPSERNRVRLSFESKRRGCADSLVGA